MTDRVESEIEVTEKYMITNENSFPKKKLETF